MAPARHAPLGLRHGPGSANPGTPVAARRSAADALVRSAPAPESGRSAAGHLELARENLALRGLGGEFVLQDAEVLPFDDNTFDLVYSNGVIHHTPNTRDVVREICRVLKPGGRAVVMVYAENSLHYWRNLVWAIGIKEHELERWSMGEIMSR